MPDNNSRLPREDLLSKLKGISFAVFMTALPTEMCLEIETMTPEGTGLQWIGYDDWQVFELRKCEDKLWRRIIERISENTLSADDIANTDLSNLNNCITTLLTEEPILSILFEDLCHLSSPLGQEFYGFFDGKKLLFFSSRDELSAALQTVYAVVDSKWEDLDTESLEYWWERYESEGAGLPLISFYDDE